jgi:hypothetical protein
MKGRSIMRTVIGIIFLIINVLFGMAALGEKDRELRKHYIYGTCFVCGVNLLMYVE